MFTKKRRPYSLLPTPNSKFSRGFTLVELLTVVMIIAILSIGGMVVYTSVNKRTHDSVRIGDATNLNQVITILLQEATTINAALLCVGSGVFPCRGSSNPAASSNNKIDGTGWVKINFVGQQNITLTVLPIDPLNNTTYHYTYCANNNQWEINTTLELNDQNKMSNDGGDDNNKYEIGTNMNLIGVVSGCSY